MFSCTKPLVFLNLVTGSPQKLIRRQFHYRKCQLNLDSSPPTDSGTQIPWHFGFQLNERYLEWDQRASNQLVKLVVAQKLGKEVEYIDKKLYELCCLVPDLIGKLEKMKPDLLIELIQNLEVVAQKSLELKELLPSVDIPDMIARSIQMFMELSMEDVRTNLTEWENVLGVSKLDLELAVSREPQILKINVVDVVQELKRLYPGKDYRTIFLKDPTMVLTMRQSSQHSSVERSS